jgi:hypothetical protein
MKAGVPASATVTDVRRSRVEINRRSRWHVAYRYEYLGRQFTGKSHPMGAEWVDGFKPGDAVQVRIDPRKPEDSLFMGPTSRPGAARD